MPPPTAGEEMNPPLPPSSVTEEPTALDRAIAQRDLEAKADDLRKKIEERVAKTDDTAKGLKPEDESKNDSKTAETNRLIVADKELRRDLDALLQKLKSLKPSREHSLAITKLQESIMWISENEKSLEKTKQ